MTHRFTSVETQSHHDESARRARRTGLKRREVFMGIPGKRSVTSTGTLARAAKHGTPMTNPQDADRFNPVLILSETFEMQYLKAGTATRYLRVLMKFLIAV
jgi:hypothetical protein